jgi:hypothetical protein
MSQRILIRIRGSFFFSSSRRCSFDLNLDVAAEFDQQVDSVIITRNLQSGKDVIKAIRSQFDSKTPILELGHAPKSPEANTNADVELDVQVRVEHSVSIEYQSWDRDKDHQRKPSFAWDSRP